VTSSRSVSESPTLHSALPFHQRGPLSISTGIFRSFSNCGLRGSNLLLKSALIFLRRSSSDRAIIEVCPDFS
jgi:hypothetical protein